MVFLFEDRLFKACCPPSSLTGVAPPPPPPPPPPLWENTETHCRNWPVRPLRAVL
jgi:hypothetical protein